MMCDLKHNTLSFVLGISELGLFLAFSFSQDTVHFSSTEKGTQQKEKNTQISCIYGLTLFCCY